MCYRLRRRLEEGSPGILDWRFAICAPVGAAKSRSGFFDIADIGLRISDFELEATGRVLRVRAFGKVVSVEECDFSRVRKIFHDFSPIFHPLCRRKRLIFRQLRKNAGINDATMQN
jgi:hypothetical protein